MVCDTATLARHRFDAGVWHCSFQANAVFELRSKAMKKITTILMLGITGLTLGHQAEARGFAHFRQGGRGGTVAAGPRGIAARGHSTTINADGSTTLNRAGGFASVNGARGARQSSTTVGRRFLRPFGQRGGNRGEWLRAIPRRLCPRRRGTWSGSRTTSATNANTGNSYNGSTSIDPNTGKPVHSGTCTNAAGQSMSCH
jgi:hypothetical protein